MNEKLKPCPFCGSPAEIDEYSDGKVGAVCSDANCKGYFGVHGSVEEAVRWWNTRQERTCYVRQGVPSIEGGDGFGTCDLVDKCSECGEIFCIHPWRGRVWPNYCPGCGAKVVAEDE